MINAQDIRTSKFAWPTGAKFACCLLTVAGGAITTRGVWFGDLAWISLGTSCLFLSLIHI